MWAAAHSIAGLHPPRDNKDSEWASASAQPGLWDRAAGTPLPARNSSAANEEVNRALGDLHPSEHY